MGFLSLFLKDKRKIAIDVGTRYFKMAILNEAKTTSSEIALNKYKIVSMPENLFGISFTDYPLLDENKFFNFLKKFVIKNNLNNTLVDICLVDTLIINNWLNINAKPNENIESLIMEKLATLLPVAINEWFIDYNVLEEKKTGQIIISEAILKKNLLGIGRLFQKTGVYPQCMDSASFNSINLFYNYLSKDENKKKNISIVNIGHESTSVMMFRDGILKTMRNIPFAGKDFTKSLIDTKAISFQDAEKYKREERFFIETVEDQNKVENYNIIKSSFGELIKGIYNSFDNYLAKFREFKIHEIILTGGSASFKNMHFVIQKHLNIPVKLGSDLVSIKYKGKELLDDEKNILSSCIGTLLRG